MAHQKSAQVCADLSRKRPNRACNVYIVLYVYKSAFKGGYKRRGITWILLTWSEHLKLHPCWLLIGWQKNCRNQAFSEGCIWVNFWLAKKCKSQTLSEGQGIVSIFGLQKKCTIETFWECMGFISRILSFFCSPGTTFLEGKGGNPTEKLAQMTTFFEEVGLDPSKQ